MPEPEQQPEGQVSEVVRMDPDAADTPISDSEHVTEGQETGPDARTGSPKQDRPY